MPATARSLVGLLVLVGALAMGGERAGRRPAVLFAAGVHAGYVARPLHAMGFELDACKGGQVAERLATGKFNVVVTDSLNEADRKAVQEFVAAGGGALVCNPGPHRSGDWTATNQWQASLGARPRWEVLVDSEPGNVARDPMGCRLSWSNNVAAPFNEGVRGVLTLLWAGTTGCEPPMSFDLSADWTAVVRGADSMRSKPDIRHDEYLQPWMPKEPGPAAPPLLAIRQAGKGRIAVGAIRYYWIFTPPSHCPTAEAMLSAGAGEKPSDWLKVFANVLRWLAEPSLKEGKGGATTPEAVLNPPVQVWPIQPPRDWTKQAAIRDIKDQGQTPGLIGARTALSSGTGSVADYVAAAKAAGLKFIVFLEDSLKMDQARWDKLVEACAAASDKEFAAVPGLTYEDAQGNHLYAFADEVKFPKPAMLLADGRLATNHSNRTKAYFDYVNEFLQQHVLSGFWRHNDNWLHPADYKLYNSFPIVSFEDGKAIDDAFDFYRYSMGIGACQAPLAFEIMTSPEQVARRAKEGWRVVSFRPPEVLRTKWHTGAWSFSGNAAQYITNGPRILVWQGQNVLTDPRGEWWRPDLWQFRVFFRVAADDGLKAVTLYDGERVFRRWLPGGAKAFETELVLYHARQLGLFLEAEDAKGRRAIGDQLWNRNLVCEEFFCSDRCNFLGSCRLRTRDGRQTWTQVSFQGNMGITPSKGRMYSTVQPAVCLTLHSPTLPIDGRPMGFPTAALSFNFRPPGEHKHLFAYPRTHLVGPEIAIGQADYALAYDPAEEGAKATPLGHPYEQPQHGWGNSWGSWHRLAPTRILSGWWRTYACNWIPEEFRIGWHETHVVLKEAVTLPKGGLQVMSASTPGWVLYGDAPTPAASSRGGLAALEHVGGSVVVAPLDGDLRFRLGAKGELSLWYVPEQLELPKGHVVRFQIGFAGAGSGTKMERLLDFAHKFGLAQPGKPGYSPSVTRGKQLGTRLVWRLDGQGAGIEAKVPKAPMPGFLPVVVEGLNDNWSAWLLDKARKGPNVRGIPVREGRGYAMLDLAEGDADLFIGHPVTCGQPELRLLVAWQEPGVWFVEAHNPTDAPLSGELRTSPGWTPFSLAERIELAPGTSKVWRVRGQD